MTLPYPPPTLVSPTVVNLGTTGNVDLGPYGDTEDVRIVLPASKRTGHVHVTGGRNIEIIGGYVTFGLSSNLKICFFFQNVKGTIFLEGLLGDCTGGEDGDFIQFECPAAGAKAIIQNCRAENMTGTFAGQHADVVQSRVLAGGMKVSNLSGSSNYQGLFMGDHGGAVGPIEVRRVNVHIQTSPDARSGIYLHNPLRFEEGQGPTGPFNHSFVIRDYYMLCDHGDYGGLGIRPRVTDPAPYTAVIADGVIRWPGLEALGKVDGFVTIGTPPGGDFVPVGAAGLGYVSPGYGAGVDDMSLSDYMETNVLAWYKGTSMPAAPATVWVALFTSDPTDAGTGNQVSGGSYARVAVTTSTGFSAITDNGAAKRISNVGPITYPTPTANWGTVTHIGIYDAASAGNLLAHGALGTPRTVNSSDPAPSFPASSLTFDLS